MICRPMVISAASLLAEMHPPSEPPPGLTPPTPGGPVPDPRLRAGPAYADPDLHTTPAGAYRHPRQYAHVSEAYL